MLTYTLLFELEVRHPYFEGGRCRHLRFEPEADTQAFLEAWGIRTRVAANRVALHAETNRLDGVWRDRLGDGVPRVLAFQVLSTDPACLAYTRRPEPYRLEPSGTGGAAIELKPVATLDADGAQARPEGPAFAAAPRASGARTVLARVRIPLVPGAAPDRDTWRAGLGTLYFVALEARATIWKYLLLGDWGPSPRMVDLAKETEFEEATEEILPDGRPAKVIRSLQAIGFQERPTQRFQLRDPTPQPERILVPRVPVATPLRLQREMVRGSPVTVSEIFLNR